jgi:hypothetical protein
MATANEMKFAVEAQVDAIASNESPAISDEQMSEFLNDAQHMIMKRIIIQGMESSEYNRQFIAPLKRAGGGSNPSTFQEGVHRNGQFWDLPANFYLMLHEFADTDQRWCVDGNLIEAGIKPVSEDYLQINKGNFQKNPYCDKESARAEVWRVSFGALSLTQSSNKYSELITDGKFNISQYKFRYLAKPRDIVVNSTIQDNQVNSELFKEFHDDIIFEAAIVAVVNMGLMSKLEAKAFINSKQEYN